MNEPIISVSGLRGIVGESLTPEVAIRYACAFAGQLSPGPIVVTRDSRSSGPMLAAAVGSGLCAVGHDVIDAGIAATPTTGVLVRQRAAAGGIQISASHNPSPYNGLKLFGSDGRVISATTGQGVLDRYRSGQIAWVDHARVSGVSGCDDPHDEHQRLVLATVDAERIRRRQFAVLLDANHGAGGLLGRRMLEDLGCRVTVLGEAPTGQFAHPPEPTAENLADVGREVLQCRADIGFCQDPDADRLAVLDERGRYIGEEFTIVLCMDHVLRQTPGPLAINCSTSRMSQDLAERFGVPLVRAAVGEANVTDAMLQHNAVFGGEGNGGPIDPRVGYVRDGFVGMALILDTLAAREATVGQLVAELPRYEICKQKTPLERDEIAAALDALEKHFADAQADRLDGLRLDWPDRWLLVRASNTEPIVRLIAEAQSAADAESLCAAAAKVLADC